MTLEQFALVIGRPFVLQRFLDNMEAYWRCYYSNTLFTDGPRAGVAYTVIACTNSRQSAREKLVGKLRGKFVRVTDDEGTYTEYAVPADLTAQESVRA